MGKLWQDGAAAIFGGLSAGTAGVVTVPAPISVAGILSNLPASGSYTLTGAEITLTAPDVTCNADFAIQNVIAGTVGLTKQRFSTLSLSGANTYTGTTSVIAGTLALEPGGSLPNTTALDIFDLLSVRTNALNSLNIDIPINIHRSAALDQAGTSNNASTINGALSLSGELRGSGPPDPSFGHFPMNGLLASIACTFSPVISAVCQVSTNTPLTISVDAGSTLTVSGTFQNFGNGTAVPGACPSGISKVGAGDLLMLSGNSYTGPTNVVAGRMVVGDGVTNAGTISGASACSISAGAELKFVLMPNSGNVSLANSISGAGVLHLFSPGVPSNSTFQFSGDLSGITGNTVVDGVRYLVLSTAVAPVEIRTGGQLAAGSAPNSTYVNQIIVTDGSGWDVGLIPAYSAGGLRIDQATFSGPITLNSDLRVCNAGSGGSALGTISGVISGPHALTFDGFDSTTTCAVSGNNTFTGGVTINSGIVRSGHVNAMGTGPVFVAAGAVWDRNGTGASNAFGGPGSVIN